MVRLLWCMFLVVLVLIGVGTVLTKLIGHADESGKFMFFASKDKLWLVDLQRHQKVEVNQIRQLGKITILGYSLSPSGKEVALQVKNDTGEQYIHVVNHEGRKILSEKSWVSLWSPDGKYIAITARGSLGFGDETPQVVIADLAGNRRFITSGKRIGCHVRAWATNSNVLFYACENSYANKTLFTVATSDFSIAEIQAPKHLDETNRYLAASRILVYADDLSFVYNSIMSESAFYAAKQLLNQNHVDTTHVGFIKWMADQNLVYSFQRQICTVSYENTPQCF